MDFYPLFRPLVFALEAEKAHNLTLKALKWLPPGQPAKPDPLLQIRVAGLDFPNPVGMAPGFDKNAEVYANMLNLGFGFAEVGTLTPLPQPGNPRPRLFRLAEDRAVINRMGFNNAGFEAAQQRLEKRRDGIVGINVGANKDNAGGKAAIADYVLGVQTMGPFADYLTVNISSPNTPGLRALQDKGALAELLTAIVEARGDGTVPIFLKLAPDLEHKDIDDISRIAIDRKMDALIVANTTITRPELSSKHRGEAGGLSGAPLKALALQRLRDFRGATGAALPLIAVGGIENGVDAFARIRAGASLVQLYSAMIFQGPAIARNICVELRRLLRRDGFRHLSEAVGTESS